MAGGTPDLEEVEVGPSAARDKTHLLLMFNGLVGGPANWAVVTESMQRQQSLSHMALLASVSNSRIQTFDGIDTGGDRLVEEIKAYVHQRPKLRNISVLGHSMGGLIARYCIGRLYDSHTGMICGLRPKHFMTMATPHLGCDSDGPAQVPVIGWTGSLPLAGSSVQQLLAGAAKPFASLALQRTGAQLFLSDGPAGSKPLLVRLTEDAGDGERFWSALTAFQTHTCYANCSGDHLVGWANASLRHTHELPVRQVVGKGRGVVREDPLDAAFLTSSGRGPYAAAAGSLGRASSHSSGQMQDCRSSRPGVTYGDVTSAGDHSADVDSRAVLDHDQNRQSAAETPVSQGRHQVQESGNEASLQILAKLQSIPWRRIDVDFSGSSMPFFAHNLIQVTRKWLNWEGEDVARHLSEQLAAMEACRTEQHSGSQRT